MNSETEARSSLAVRRVTSPDRASITPARGRISVLYAEASLSDRLLDGTVLASAEKIRAARMRPAARARFVTGRGVLRLALAPQLDVDPGAVPIVRDARGKPRLASAAGREWEFNLSHAGSLVAVAIAQGVGVGIDIECRARGATLSRGLVESLLAPEERRWVRRVAGISQGEALIDLWTAKEAVAKLLGLGLRLPFHQIVVDEPSARTTVARVRDTGRGHAECLLRRPELTSAVSAAVATPSQPADGDAKDTATR